MGEKAPDKHFHAYLKSGGCFRGVFVSCRTGGKTTNQIAQFSNMNLNSAARVSPVLRLDRPKERERSREKERERERELEESRSEQSARGTARAARALARARDEGSNHRSQ